MTTSLEKVQLTTLLARKPPPRTKPSKKRLQQLKKDRERTAAHHREALLGRLEPSVLRDSVAKRNAILRLGRRWFHGESEAVRQAYFAGKSVSSDVGACPLERRPDGIAESGGGGGGSAAVAPCARQPSPKICAPARRYARSCQVRAPPMKFLLGMQVPPTISEKTASPFIACGRTMKKRRTQAGADTCKGNNKSKQDQQHDHTDDHEHDRDDYHDDNAMMIILTC